MDGMGWNQPILFSIATSKKKNTEKHGKSYIQLWQLQKGFSEAYLLP